MPARSLVVLLLSAGLSAIAEVAAQGPPIRPVIKVAVALNDSSGQVSAAIASALRQLGDVVVVSRDEDPRYFVDGVVRCEPSCSAVSRYVVSLRLATPILRATTDFLADAIVKRAGLDPAARDSTGAGGLFVLLRAYDRSHETRIVVWSRTQYELGAREYVRELDFRCFDRFRALSRATESRSAEGLSRYEEFEKSRKWICE